MKRSPSFTWPLRSAHSCEDNIDLCADLRTLREQKEVFFKQYWARQYYNKEKFYWDLAKKNVCVTI